MGASSRSAASPGVGGRIIEVLDDRAGRDGPGTGSHHAVGAGSPAGLGELARRRPDRGQLRAGRRWHAGDGRARRARRWRGQRRHRVEPSRAEVVRRVVRETRDHVQHEQIDIARLSLGIFYARPAAAATMARRGVRVRVGSTISPRAPTLSRRADTAIRGSSSGSAMPCSTSSSLKVRGPAAPRPTSLGCTSMTSKITSPAPRATARPSWRRSTPYPGSSVYVADDLEGNRWTFSQARPTMR